MESLLDGLASGLTYALLAAALTLAHVAWLGLDRPRLPGADPRLHLAAALPASGTVLTAVIAPEVKALAAALAAGPGSPLAAALLALLVGLAEGAAATVAADGWLSVWPRAAGYAVLLPFLLLRPDRHWFEDAGDG